MLSGREMRFGVELPLETGIFLNFFWQFCTNAFFPTSRRRFYNVTAHVKMLCENLNFRFSFIHCVGTYWSIHLLIVIEHLTVSCLKQQTCSDYCTIIRLGNIANFHPEKIFKRLNLFIFQYNKCQKTIANTNKLRNAKKKIPSLFLFL